ncbi:glutathione S-transferase C-terminal domain-containing protein [Parvibaculum sp.]|uniref:glutathione S-transferase C-terminal domain-containing protein n=1 Tax=Alphaproteobacteria TaxID=28211 RepID=UPI001B032945|nr:glutathione S-transferase C-terminal domain-containing protein [Parvibaculum sp.]MBO6693540.1 glutathione S-transferase family protein [Parvibaculum sp.]MBO6715307.1 glutathione S-transferase family protein [Parvibaculum sp.]
MTYQLWGSPNSLYTGKVRSYLIKQRIPFENRAAGEARFREKIVPQIGRWIVPVLEAENGALVQDGSDIIAHLEGQVGTRHPAYPATPVHALIGQVFELFGGEGLLRPAMHYRWNFDEVNRPFLSADFSASLAPTNAPAAVKSSIYDMASQRMREAMASFGVSRETIPAVEASFAEFLSLFDAHLEHSPYLLGGRPTIGDYGLVAPLYAHLARDPYPARIMQQSAHRVWRWTERMNRPDQDAGEHGHPAESLFPGDHVSDTLKALLRFVAEDYLPEIRAFVAYTNEWLAARPDLAVGTNGLDRAQDRRIGEVAFDWRGHRIVVGVMPYRIYLLQKVQDVVGRASPAEQADMRALLEETGLADLLALRTTRRVERRNHLEVWGDKL